MALGSLPKLTPKSPQPPKNGLYYTQFKQTTNMIKQLTVALATLALALPASATPRAVDNGLMAEVPGYGPSRVETISFCLNESGVDRYQDLLTDTQVEGFDRCLRDQT